MTMTLGKRIEQAMNEKGFTRKKLADALKVTTMTVGDIINGKTQKPRNLIDIATVLGVDPVWLQTGKGEMHEYPTVEWIDKGKDYQEEGYVEVEVFNIKLSAGEGKPVIEWQLLPKEEPILLSGSWFRRHRLNPDECKGMIVRGNSMSPVLENLDLVIVDIGDTDIIDGEVYALVYRNNFFIKQAIRTGNTLTLNSFNSDYEPIVLDETDQPHLQIIGRKVWRGG